MQDGFPVHLFQSLNDRGEHHPSRQIDPVIDRGESKYNRSNSSSNEFLGQNVFPGAKTIPEGELADNNNKVCTVPRQLPPSARFILSQVLMRFYLACRYYKLVSFGRAFGRAIRNRQAASVGSMRALS
jgi:hypothetical protein